MAKKKPSKELEELEEQLTLKQQLFSRYYLFGNESTKLERWNWTRSYMLAYQKEEKDENECAVNWSKTLRIAKVKLYMRQLLEDEWFNDNFVDWVLLNKIKEWDMTAIKEYNNLMQRITKKLEVNWNLDLTSKEIDKKPLEELKDWIQALLNK